MPIRRAIAVEQPVPDREQEQQRRGRHPDERVALQQPPLAHELEHEQEQEQDRADRGEPQVQVHQSDAPAADTGAASPFPGTGRRRTSPTPMASRTLIM